MKVDEGMRKALLEIIKEGSDSITSGNLERFLEINKQVESLGASLQASGEFFAQIREKVKERS